MPPKKRTEPIPDEPEEGVAVEEVREPAKRSKKDSNATSYIRHLSIPTAYLEKKLECVDHVLVQCGTSRCKQGTNRPINSGYIQLNWKNCTAEDKANGIVPAMYSLHILAILAVGKWKPTDNHEVSHLCHNKKCFNPEHLIWEEGRNNLRRNCCPFIVDGRRICEYIHAGPACIARHPGLAEDRDETGKFPGY